MRLKDKVAVITGGSRGIGLATAKAFLKEGAAVVVTASTEENAQRAAKALQAEFPGSRVGGISPELTSFSSVQQAFEKVKEEEED